MNILTLQFAKYKFYRIYLIIIFHKLIIIFYCEQLHLNKKESKKNSKMNFSLIQVQNSTEVGMFP